MSVLEPARPSGCPPRERVTGALLCGGASRRMGRDKARLELGERRLMDFPLEALASVAGRTLLASGPASPPAQAATRFAELGLQEVADTGPGEGPLRGLLAALEAAETPWLCVLACDMPGASAATLERLLARAAGDDLDVCLAEVERGSQPLFGVYHTRVARCVRAALERGERRLVAFHGGLRVATVPLGERAAEARNLNTPEEFARELADERRRRA